MSAMDSVNLEISIDHSDWSKALPNYQNLIEECIGEVASNVREGRALSNFIHIELSIVLCSDELIHKLNHEYREKNKATNVLSFCGLDESEIQGYLRHLNSPEQRPYSLGEIYIAYETMDSEAKAASKSLKDHFQHLVIHGVLHLLGYDHIIDDEAEQMEALETLLLSNLGIDDPYHP